MEIDFELVRALAEQAGLELREEDLPEMVRSLGSLVEDFQSLAEVDTDGVAPLVHPFPGVMGPEGRVTESAPLPSRRYLLPSVLELGED